MDNAAPQSTCPTCTKDLEANGWCFECRTYPRGVAQPDGIHTIPVPRGWSPEQAWEAIKRGDDLTDKRSRWANVRIENGRFMELLDA